MSTLEKLRSFFRLCQFLGFLPFRMNIDDETGKFQGFSYSWKYPITWWYIVTSIASMVFFVFLLEVLFKSTDIDDLPFIIKITTKTDIVLNFVLIISTRYWLIFKHHALANAIEFMKKIETNLERDSKPNCKNGIKFRTVFGATSCCLGSSFGLFAIFRTLYIQLYATYGFGGIILMSIATFGFLMAPFSATMFTHLIYGQISYYIRLLLSQLVNTTNGEHSVENLNFLRTRTSARLQERIKSSRRLFGYICCAISNWNDIFSFPILFLVATMFITTAFSLFGFIQGFFIQDIVFSGVHWLLLSFFLIDFSLMLLVFWSTDGPVQEAVDFRETVMRLCNSNLMNSTEEILQGLTIREYIREDRLRLSTGLFTVGIHLVPPIVGSIVTCLVILFQTQRQQ